MSGVNDMWLFLTVPWVGMQFVIVVFPDHNHLPFGEDSTVVFSLFF